MPPVLHFEDFPVGRTEEFGPCTADAGQIRDFANRYDPRPALLAGPTPTASPWMLPALLMRMNYDGWVHRTAARGAPGVDELRWFRPVRAGDRLTGRYQVVSARASRSKPELGLVRFLYELLDANRQPVLSQTNSVMITRHDRSPVAAGEPTASRAGEAQADTGEDVTIGTCGFSPDDIVSFARQYDPQPFHVDEAAAAAGPFGALAASGWHTAAAWMHAYVQAIRRSGIRLPAPGQFTSVTDLRWLRPVYAGDRLLFSAAGPLNQNNHDDSEIRLRGSGVNQAGLRVYEFTATMTVADNLRGPIS